MIPRISLNGFVSLVYAKCYYLSLRVSYAIFEKFDKYIIILRILLE